MGASKKSQSIVTFHLTKSTDPHTEIQQMQHDLEKMDTIPFQLLLRKAEIFVQFVAGISEVWSCVMNGAWLNFNR